MKKIKLKKENTAAFDVDIQNGFTPNCPNELPVPGGNEIVDECLETHKITKFKIMSKDAHPPKGKWLATDENPVFSEVGLPNVDIRWPNHCVVGTKGFELLEGLPHPSEYDFIVYKGVETDMHPYSPIYHDLQKKISTGVIEFGKINQIDNFILNGLALDYCLKEAAIDLAEYFNVYVNMSGTRGVNEETSIKAIKEMKEAGVIFIDSLDEISIDDTNMEKIEWRIVVEKRPLEDFVRYYPERKFGKEWLNTHYPIEKRYYKTEKECINFIDYLKEEEKIRNGVYITKIIKL